MSTTYQIDTPEMRFALAFATEAGKLIRDKFAQGLDADWKQNETPVTAVDLELNRRFIEEVERSFPGYGILGEEASKPIEGAEWIWVVDPIDGTGPFVQGIPLSTCCIALVHDGTPVLGVIYDALLDRMFYAQKGQGAFLNDRPIHVSDATSLNRGYVHGDSMRTGDRRLMPLRLRLIEQGCTPMFLNAIQYGTALVCAGRGTGVVYSLPHAWDVAAGYAIGTEAGGVMTDLYGNEQRYDQPTKGIIFANPTVHKQLVEMVKGILEDPSGSKY